MCQYEDPRTSEPVDRRRVGSVTTHGAAEQNEIEFPYVRVHIDFAIEPEAA